MPKGAPKDFVGLRLPPELVNAIDMLAKEQTRPRSNMIEFILIDWLREHRPELLVVEEGSK